ncbi:hypothetical protein [Alteromonas lipolytica]|uniref:Uncharacterized protein n=1 Tax=Alteromonas lipolytica TaxID=1856405 RepID=A0A1E8FBI4_9ALTE|nr:hypothetical protein [Alteromonas lipolytica]OFI33270.1 hypothetical protein BFC17_03140 [Alteromonas lipolytica]GGF61133.1 hypothetical protein GCM10011338_11750 [Alteromonas lipolytica]
MENTVLITPETEQQYLTYTGKISVVFAVFLLATALSSLDTEETVVSWGLGLITLISAVSAFVISLKSMKFSKHTTRLGFWTLKFNDEYVDYVSALSLRTTCHVMLFGGLVLAYFGDDKWFIQLIAPLSLSSMIQILLSIALLTHGLLIMTKMREDEADE